VRNGNQTESNGANRFRPRPRPLPSAFRSAPLLARCRRQPLPILAVRGQEGVVIVEKSISCLLFCSALFPLFFCFVSPPFMFLQLTNSSIPIDDITSIFAIDRNQQVNFPPPYVPSPPAPRLRPASRRPAGTYIYILAHTRLICHFVIEWISTKSIIYNTTNNKYCIL